MPPYSGDLGAELFHSCVDMPHPGDSTRELGVPISRPTVIPAPTKTKLSPLAGANQREKISFGIKPHGASEKAVYSQKPRIVMHIKKGKVSYSSVSDKPGSGTSPKPQNVAAKTSPVSNRTLVPYDDDDSDTLLTKGVASSDCREQKRDGEKTVTPLKTNKSFEPVFDKQLNATTAVPGAYGSLDKDVTRTGHDVKPKNGSSCESVSKASQGKLKHKLDECLTVQVVPAAAVAKVNATSRWEVQHQDAEAPSSIGSCSSSGSVNSTTKFEVTPHRCPASSEEQLSPLEMAYLAGFTVKPKPDSVTDTTETVTPLTNGKKSDKTTTEGHVASGSADSSSANSAVTSDIGKTSAGDVSSDTLPGSTTPSCNGEKRKHKRHKKKHKREETKEEEDVPRKKKHKQKREAESSSDAAPDGARLSSSDASSTADGAELVWVEKTKETIEKEHSKTNSDSKGELSYIAYLSVASD